MFCVEQVCERCGSKSIGNLQVLKYAYIECLKRLVGLKE